MPWERKVAHRSARHIDTEKTAAIVNVPKVSPPLKQVYTRSVYLEVDAWSVLQLSDLGRVDFVQKTCLISKQSQHFPSWASAGLKC